MKHWKLTFIMLLFLGAGAFWLFHRPPPGNAPRTNHAKLTAPSKSVSHPVSAQPVASPETAASLIVATPASEPQRPTAAIHQNDSAPVSEGALAEVQNLTPAASLDQVRRSIRDFASRFNGNPVGTNPEITQALNGANPKQVKFLDPAIHRINQKGELLDTWGTPYFFHQLSAFEMEIRSAGPDKIMWTEDDLLTQ